MQDFSNFLTFRVDPALPLNLRKILDVIFASFKNARIEEHLDSETSSPGRLTVEFISEASLHLIGESSTFKICLLDRNQGLFSFGQNLETSHIDAILDDSLDVIQIHRLIEPEIFVLVKAQEDQLYSVGAKNIRKFESRAKQETSNSLHSGSGLTSVNLLNYAQALVDLEKELIHTTDIGRIEKVLKQFVKNQIEKTKFNFFTSVDISRIQPSKSLITLPRFKGEFLAIDFEWDDSDYFQLIKKLFFVYTLVNFFSFKQVVQDPFFDDGLWDSVLDSIPFPIALFSYKGEVYQHNSLFSKLNLTPGDCLGYKQREKTLINDIPYNVYRKDVHHLDESKILFVFFTESFFLKGDGNLTPSGQELGIISSSIAHELNNPIAGIQAALSLLMLEESLNEEAVSTLTEMKNGSTRCKQLIETFLGFSRANPRSLSNLELKLSSVELCYQQAQNLLRFRTVESGIRFSFEFSRHSDFRATVNLSLLTMTFYLIFGELMTLYSHQLLVADKNQIEKVIKGEIIESSQEIQIQLHELNISSLSISKLIHNLLTIENFILQVSDYSLRFIYNPPRDAL